MFNYNSSWGPINISILVLILLTISLFWGANIWVKYQCHAIGAQMKVETQYSIYTGCLVQVRGNWIPLSNYRVLG